MDGHYGTLTMHSTNLWAQNCEERGVFLSRAVERVVGTRSREGCHHDSGRVGKVLFGTPVAISSLGKANSFPVFKSMRLHTKILYRSRFPGRACDKIIPV